ncbi:MAG: hypothetical protein ABIG61_10530 [Planctomycetota bacterium]
MRKTGQCEHFVRKIAGEAGDIQNEHFLNRKVLNGVVSSKNCDVRRRLPVYQIVFLFLLVFAKAMKSLHD